MMTVLGPPILAADGGYQVRDEWQPIDRIVLQTDPTLQKLNPVAETVAIEAIKQGIKVVVVDDDPKSQQEILSSLARNGIAKPEAWVVLTDTKHTTDWARDEAPVERFDDKGQANLTGMLHQEAGAGVTQGIIKDVGNAIATPTSKVPNLPSKDPLFCDGGDWLTTQNGKTLITTSKFYENNGGADNVNGVLKSEFGIDKTVELKPLDPDAAGYKLPNQHVDLQVRTLPGNSVIVAQVPKADPQYEILEGNAQKLKDAGFEVVRIANAPKAADDSSFKSYANAAFLNNSVLIPRFGDTAADEAARQAYDKALNDDLPPDSPKRWKIVQVDASKAIQYGGAMRCAMRELSRAPSIPKELKAATEGSRASFDASRGVLSFTGGMINFLGEPDASATNPDYASDPLLGANLVVGDLLLDLNRSAEDRYAFMGGSIRLEKDGNVLLSANLPVFSIYGSAYDGALSMFGVLSDVQISDPSTSPWMSEFMRKVLDSPDLFADFFIQSAANLVDLSAGFTRGFDAVQLSGGGITGNGGRPIPEAWTAISSAVLFAAGALALCLARKRGSLP